MATLYGINHPLVKREYPIIYQIFGADRKEQKAVHHPIANSRSIRDSSTINFAGQGKSFFDEQRKKLKQRLDNNITK